MIHQSKPEYMTLINGRGYSLHSFSPPPFEGGIWQLTTWTELITLKTKTKTIAHINAPVPVLINLSKKILLLNFGLSNQKGLLLNTDVAYRIALTHIKGGDLLTGKYNTTDNTMSWALAYRGKEQPTVFLEFQKMPLNPSANADNPGNGIPSE
jgi:hypothetical protein